MQAWYNAEPNIFMSLNDVERVCSFRARAKRTRTAYVHQAGDTHCHSLRVTQA